MIISHTVNKPATVVSTESTVSEYKPNMVDAVQYKTSVERGTRMSRHKAVDEQDEENLKLDWNKEVHFSNEYTGFRDKFLDMLCEFQFMWNGHMKQVNMAENLTKIKFKNIRSIHSASYQAGPDTLELINAEIDKMLVQKFTKHYWKK